MAAVVFAASTSALAREPRTGETIEGEITSVDLVGTPRHIVVREADGNQVQVRVHVSSRISLPAGDRDLSPELSNLKPGMRVRTVYNGGEPTPSIDILNVPEALRGGNTRPGQNGTVLRKGASAVSDDPAVNGHQLKVRLLDINERDIRADVAGQSRQFQLDSPRMAASFHEGDLVVVTVENENSSRPMVVDIRSAAERGRIVEVDSRIGSIRVALDSGREDTFILQDKKLLTARTGDYIRFEVEERSGGQRVITSLRRD